MDSQTVSVNHHNDQKMGNSNGQSRFDRIVSSPRVERQRQKVAGRLLVAAAITESRLGSKGLLFVTPRFGCDEHCGISQIELNSAFFRTSNSRFLIVFQSKPI
jgi:hypothetical protein